MLVQAKNLPGALASEASLGGFVTLSTAALLSTDQIEHKAQALCRLQACEGFSKQISSFAQQRYQVNSIQETTQLLLGVWLCALILILCTISLDAFGGGSQPLTSEQYSGEQMCAPCLHLVFFQTTRSGGTLGIAAAEYHLQSLIVDGEESTIEPIQGQFIVSTGKFGLKLFNCKNSLN